MPWKPPAALKKAMEKNQLAQTEILKGDLQPPLKIVAHRRSGNHLLWENLHINYNLEDAAGEDGDQFKYHRPFKDALKGFTDKYTCVLLVRDPRDVLVSNWFYWINGGEQKAKVDKLLANKTFSEYLRGIDPKELDKFQPERDEMDMYLIKEHIKDPIGHWMDYIKWQPEVKSVIRYEDLISDPEKIIVGFGKQFNLKQTKDKIKTVKKDYNNILVGYKGRKGIVGDWKNYFSQEDLDFVLGRAYDIMQEYDYTDVNL